jgi:hypothetical protein
MCLLVPWCLPGRISERDLIPLPASHIAGAGTIEGSGIQSEANEGDPVHGWNNRSPALKHVPHQNMLIRDLLALQNAR